MQDKIRIAKYIANAGYCSRRDAEKLIEDRLVKINDQLCVHPSDTVTANDKITCLLYTSPSPRDGLLSRMPSSA